MGFLLHLNESRRPFQRQELIFGSIIKGGGRKGRQTVGVVEEKEPFTTREIHTTHKLAIFLKSQKFL